jgi:hypothetical protein
MASSSPRRTPFNGSVEIGLRALCLLTHSFPEAYSVERLTALDYLVVHSDDVPGGPVGLHPRTPFRGGELLVRRAALQEGLALYESRGLLLRQFGDGGIRYAATEGSGAFLDSLGSPYSSALRSRAAWAVARFASVSDSDIRKLVDDNVGAWGAEFEYESVLYEEEIAG